MLQGHDDPLILAGQATAGIEILRQHSSIVAARQQGSPARSPLDAIFLPVGGGSLLAGVAAAVKQLNPTVKVIGVEPQSVDVLRQSLMSGSRVTIEEPGVDGIWVPQLGEEVYRLCDTLVDDVVCVSDDEIREAIRDGFEDTRALLEPAGALTCSLWLHLLTIGCAYLLWLRLLPMAVLTRRLLGGGTYGYRLPCIRLQARLRSRASRSGRRSSRRRAPTGRHLPSTWRWLLTRATSSSTSSAGPHAHTCRAGVAVPAAAAPGTCGSRRPRAGLRQSLGSEGSESHGRVGWGLGWG